ncbi:hypothetical protein ElyMa_001912100 [Elysia marginata]|uniref:Uncharacterized protein n=1 Tax=Elysia marginata TaxID=1093978 RepID=A0AAV4EST2_9GAST|nr:hypothetical protein ElyMa_001912100 [Elysia marginata]
MQLIKYSISIYISIDLAKSRGTTIDEEYRSLLYTSKARRFSSPKARRRTVEAEATSMGRSWGTLRRQQPWDGHGAP